MKRSFKGAISALKQESQKRKHNPLGLGSENDLGIALLGNCEFKDALDIFVDLINKHSRQCDEHYLYCGFAYWYSGKFAKAIEVWTEGTKCRYSNGFLLNNIFAIYFASVMKPKLVNKSRFLELLSRRMSAILVEDWPVPIARYLNDKISDSDLQQLAQTGEGKYAKLISALWTAQAQFYMGLRHFEMGHRLGFVDHLSSCVTVKGVREVFPEFVIAHIELTRMKKKPRDK